MLSAGICSCERPRRNFSPSRFSRRFCPPKPQTFCPAKPRRRPLLCLALAFAVLFAVPAFARTLRIRDFHAELDVLPDSSLDVTETIRVDFSGAWQGIYRTIPVDYAGPGGFNYSLFLTDISATDTD